MKCESCEEEFPEDELLECESCGAIICEKDYENECVYRGSRLEPPEYMIICSGCINSYEDARIDAAEWERDYGYY